MQSGHEKSPREPSREVLANLDSPESHIESEPTLRQTVHPNDWARWRSLIREPAAEFLGTMLLVLVGDGVVCQVVLSSNSKVASSPKGDYLSICFGWALGGALGVWACGGISGGHINPAVTLSLAVFRRFPWKKVPSYIFAQLLGGLCAAGCVYANYIHAIDIVEGGRGIRTVPGTAGLFATYALDYMTSVSCFFDEFIGTAILLITILAATDKGNIPPPSGLMPLVIFFAILSVGIAFGSQTGFAINPARDFGPRLLTAMVGYGAPVFTYRNQYWLWCGILAPFLGALVGSLTYDTLVFAGSDSPVNTPNAIARAHQERARKSARDKVPAGADVV